MILVVRPPIRHGISVWDCCLLSQRKGSSIKNRLCLFWPAMEFHLSQSSFSEFGILGWLWSSLKGSTGELSLENIIIISFPWVLLRQSLCSLLRGFHQILTASLWGISEEKEDFSLSTGTGERMIVIRKNRIRSQTLLITLCIKNYRERELGHLPLTPSEP